MLSGGTLNLHGNRTNTWTKLSRTAEAGSNTIEVLNAAQWQVGDEIVLASTDFNPRQAERRTISAINGNNITLGLLSQVTASSRGAMRKQQGCAFRIGGCQGNVEPFPSGNVAIALATREHQKRIHGIGTHPITHAMHVGGRP
jgi:hypothetical protein